jgi:hypothetical protein
MSATVAPLPPPSKRVRRLAGRLPAARERADGARGDGGAVRLWLCAAPTLALLLAWATSDGGYETTAWLEGGLALVIIAAWSRLAFGRSRALGHRGRPALGALALYVAWSYASVLWAADKGTALLGSDRALLYLVLFALFASLGWTARRLGVALLLYLLGVEAFALLTVAKVALSPAHQLLLGAQLAAGTGYHNATAALGTIGAFGSILIGSSRRHRPALRALLAAGATACLEVSVLAQSRGWLYTLPIIALIVLAVAPARGRAVAWALIPVAATIASGPWVVHGASEGAGRAALIAALLSGSAAMIVARLQQRYTLSRRGRGLARGASRTAATAAAVAALGGAALLLGSGALARGWHQFTTDAPVASAGTHRFTDLGSGRYDFWRVALDSFEAHPVGGLGQDNFAQAYVADRRTNEEPAWVHSLELRLLTHTGAVGLGLFAAFLVLALGAFRLAVRGADRGLRLTLAAALVPLVVWLVHGSVDWFWEIPALSAPAFAFLGAVVALEPGRERTASTPTVAVLGATAAALAVLGPTYVGERALQDGRALATARPAVALRDLRLAAELEPLSSAPHAVEASIQLRTGGGGRALREAAAGLRRDPGDWVLWLEDGLAAGAAGRPEVERAALHRARALDPREPVIALAQRRAGTQDPLTIVEAQSMLDARAQARVAP